MVQPRVSGVAEVNNNRLLVEENLAFIGCSANAVEVDADVVKLLSRITATIGGEVVVEPPSVVGIAVLLASVLLMSMKLQVLNMSFCTQGRVDAKRPSVVELKPEEVDAVEDGVFSLAEERYNPPVKYLADFAVSSKKYARSILHALI
jgi:hypothetical protein